MRATRKSKEEQRGACALTRAHTSSKLKYARNTLKEISFCCGEPFLTVSAGQVQRIFGGASSSPPGAELPQDNEQRWQWCACIAPLAIATSKHTALDAQTQSESHANTVSTTVQYLWLSSNQFIYQ